MAVDAEGHTRWTTPLAAGQQTQAGIVTDGATVFTTESGEVQALDALSGRSRWRRQLGQEVYGIWLKDQTLVVVLDQVGPNAQVVGIDPAAGSTRWTQPIPEGLFADQVLTADGGLVVFKATGHLAVIDVASGKYRWSVDTPTGHAIATGGSSVLAVAGSVLTAYDTITGKVNWRAAFDPQASPLTDRAIVTNSADTQPDPRPLSGYDIATGRVRWQLPVPGTNLLVQTITPAGIMLTAGVGSDRVIELVDPDTGTVRWRSAQTGVAPDPLPVVAGNDLVTGMDGGSTGSVVTWRISDGRVGSPVGLPGFLGPTMKAVGTGVLVTTESGPGGAPGALVRIAAGQVIWTTPLPELPDRGLVLLPDGTAVVQVATPGYGCAL